MNLFIPIGQRGLSFSKNKVFRRNGIFIYIYSEWRAKQTLERKKERKKERTDTVPPAAPYKKKKTVLKKKKKKSPLNERRKLSPSEFRRPPWYILHPQSWIFWSQVRSRPYTEISIDNHTAIALPRALTNNLLCSKLNPSKSLARSGLSCPYITRWLVKALRREERELLGPLLAIVSKACPPYSSKKCAIQLLQHTQAKHASPTLWLSFLGGTHSYDGSSL